MEMRYDVVIRERFMWILLGTKKDVCTVISTNQGLYMIYTGKPGAVINIPLGGAVGSAIARSSQKTYMNVVQENQAKITPANLEELAKRRGNTFVPFEEIVNVQLGGPGPEMLEHSRSHDPAAGPALKIKTKKGKFTLVFCRHTYEQVDPLFQFLQSQAQDRPV